jgi:hypothetical protein
LPPRTNSQARFTTAVEADAYAARHITLGLSSLLVYTVVGFGLEALHAFKLQAYLAVSNDTRRLMWTLGHAHGTLLGLIDIAIGGVLRIGLLGVRRIRAVWWLLAVSTIALPSGFFLGGIAFYSGDPGVGAALIPLGAVALIAALALAVNDVTSAVVSSDAPPRQQRAR